MRNQKIISEIITDALNSNFSEAGKACLEHGVNAADLLKYAAAYHELYGYDEAEVYEHICYVIETKHQIREKIGDYKHVV